MLNKAPSKTNVKGVDAGTAATDAVGVIAAGNKVLTLEVLTDPGVDDIPGPAMDMATPVLVVTSRIILTVPDCVAPTTIEEAFVAFVNTVGTAAGIAKAESLELSSLIEKLSVSKSLKNW